MEYPKFKVCCNCFTFNQAKYITEAMNGFTMQQTSFPFVCTIVDDASTDGEQDVIRKYLEDNFDFSEGSVAYHKETDYAHITYAQHKTNKNCYFAVLYLKENHYSQRKPKMGYLSEWRDMCEYEALCEGDDYWIVPGKLEKQVNILELKQDIVLVVTDVNRYFQTNKKVEYSVFSNKIRPLSNNFRQLLMYATWLAPCTWMYRKKYRDNNFCLPKDCFKGDIAVALQLLSNANMFFVSDTTACYRVLNQSASHFIDNKSSDRFYLSVINTRCFYARSLDFHFRTKLFLKICKELRCRYINRKRFRIDKFLFHMFVTSFRLFIMGGFNNLC